MIEIASFFGNLTVLHNQLPSMEMRNTKDLVLFCFVILLSFIIKKVFTVHCS